MTFPYLPLQKTSAWTWQEKYFSTCTKEERSALADAVCSLEQTAANKEYKAKRVPACMSCMSNSSWRIFAWKFKYCLDYIIIFTLAAGEEHASMLEKTVRPCRRRGAVTAGSTHSAWIICQRQLSLSTLYCSKLSVRLFLCQWNLFSWQSSISFLFIDTSGDVPYL